MKWLPRVTPVSLLLVWIVAVTLLGLGLPSISKVERSGTIGVMAGQTFLLLGFGAILIAFTLTLIVVIRRTMYDR